MSFVIAGGTAESAATLGHAANERVHFISTKDPRNLSLPTDLGSEAPQVLVIRVEPDAFDTDEPGDLAPLEDGVLGSILPLQALASRLTSWSRVLWVVRGTAVDGTDDPRACAVAHAALGAMRAITREYAATVSTAAIVIGDDTADAEIATAVAALTPSKSRFYTGQVLRLDSANAAMPVPEPADGAARDRVAVVTGAAAGMGRGYAQALLDEGWRVYAVDRDASGLASLTDENASDRVAYWTGDLRESEAWRAIIVGVHERFGVIDGLVNNAGYGLQRPLVELGADDIVDQLRIHVGPALELSRGFASDLEQRNGGIVNVSSTYALAGPCTYPQPPAVAYCMAKSAVIGVTRALARQLGPRVRANAIAPGGTRSATTLDKYSPELLEKKIAGVPTGRWAEPDEYSVFVRYLLAREAVPVTGQVLSPNGGEVIGQC